jgi:peptidoglycan-associated lipoprotein
MRTQLTLTFAALLASLSIGCAEPAPEPKTPPPAPAPEPAPAPAPAPQGKETDDPARSEVNVSDKIRQLCGISEKDTKFGYNSAQVSSRDKEVFKKLADCFTTGPLKGQTMHLVGHADPRGEPEYNMQLGEKRAGNVAKAVMGAGLAEAQVTTTSRGELDAHGTDESSWAEDRKVDIDVAQ